MKKDVGRKFLWNFSGGEGEKEDGRGREKEEWEGRRSGNGGKRKGEGEKEEEEEEEEKGEKGVKQRKLPWQLLHGLCVVLRWERLLMGLHTPLLG